ncbi:TRAP transporter small permease [Halomonas sp. hl-4]|uniref:TRAP transporter small permease n=1 Tax=Halomonas sp. hl-4 TaxID=1761789 RepID=UPI000BB7B195|nr:TRAP transporter small permease [Halomonas sp. hl-4]SNY96722.1 TRAP-type C4-dicarboxylate transport system, small permease component [Halomonas sp. hl-4]
MTSYVMRGWDGLMAVLRGASILVLAFMALTICYDAMMRHVFSAPTSWSLEINSFLLVYLAVMGAAEAQRHDAHIRIEFFADKLPVRVQALVGVATGLLGATFSFIMVWRGGIMMSQAFEYGERVSSSLGTPIGIPYAMLPLGFGLLGLQFLLNAWQSACRVRHPDAAPPPNGEPGDV